jgi:hypothetical protein
MSDIKDRVDEDDRSDTGEEERYKAVDVDVGNEKERMIAKAALTVAELGKLDCHMLKCMRI